MTSLELPHDAAGAPTAPPPPGGLRKGTIGVPGMVFMVVACAAPLTAMASNFTLSLGAGAGAGTLGWIVVVGLLLVVFSAGYLALSRVVVSAGAYHAYVSYGLGRQAGGAVAFVASIAYNLACAAMVVAAGFFTDLTLATYAGFDIHWAWYAAAALAILGVLGHVGIDVAAKVTAAVSLLQFALLGLLFVTVLVRDPGRFSPDGFSPASMGGGGAALTVVFVLLSFAGYEAAAAFGEECDAPGPSIRRATYLSLGLLAAVFLLGTWTIIAAYEDLGAAFAANPGGLLDGAFSAYLGSSVGAVVSAVVAFSFVAAAVSFHNLASRYAFALGRARLLPAALARTHPKRGTPTVATIVQIAVNLLIITPFVVSGADPLTVLFPAVSGVTSLALIAMTVLCSLSALYASLRHRLPGSVLATRVAPVVAATGLTLVGALIITNYGKVTGSDSSVIAAMPLLLVVGAAAGAYAAQRTAVDVAQALAEPVRSGPEA